MKELLHSNFNALTEWFDDYCMIINPHNCSYICLSKNNNDDDSLNFNEFNLKNSGEEITPKIKIDQKLAFNSHIKT